MDDKRFAIRFRLLLSGHWLGAPLTLLLLLAAACPTLSHAITEVTDFGSNPGDLRMFVFVPANAQANAPLVVALHGCTQRASDYAEQSGWRELAERHGFLLLLAEQRAENNQRRCFNWFNGWALSDFWLWSEWGSDQTRDSGEALSIKQMIDEIARRQSLDPGRVYVTGLSGGGAMTAVMLAAYPEIFAGGAILAGVPYKCATNSAEALTRCGVDLTHTASGGTADLSPTAWATRVRNETGHQGPWPRVSIWHGLADPTVAPGNARELLEQWTAVHDIDSQPDEETQTGAVTRRSYRDGQGITRVETYLIGGMAHGVPIHPGTGIDRCGQSGPHAFAIGLCASAAIGKFWGIVP